MRSFFTIILLLPIFGITQIHESSYQLNRSREIIDGTGMNQSTRHHDSLIILIDYKTCSLVKREYNGSEFTSEEYQIKSDYFYANKISLRSVNDLDSAYNISFNSERNMIYYYQFNQDTTVHVREYSGSGIKIIETNLLYKGFWEEDSEDQEAYLLDLNLLNGDWRIDIEHDTIIWTYQIDTIYSKEIDYRKSAAHGRKYYTSNLTTRGQYFYITINSESQVIITDRNGCFANEYWIRKLTEDELILFDGSGVIRFLKE